MELQTNNPELNISSSDLTGILSDVLKRGSSVRFRAKGYSMSPIIKNSDVITVSPCPPAKLRAGDIAAFTRNSSDRLVVHRIVGIRGELFLMKGDNAADFDGFIPGSQILGQVTRIERDGRDLRLGLGLGRKVIALLSRFRLLPSIAVSVRMLLRPREKTA